MRGIILAGGTGTRLWPATKAVSKQLMPVHDKPMIYYPLSTLITAGVREVLVIVAPDQEYLFRNLLGDGSSWGMEIFYAVQERPEGIAQALLIGEEFLDGGPCALILGDNLFHGDDVERMLRGIHSIRFSHDGALVFGYPVANPRRYGVLEFDAHGNPCGIVEKPDNPPSPYAVPGLYFLDERAVQIARELKPSARGELEIADVLRWYIERKELTVVKMRRGSAWLDTGTTEALMQASEYVRILEDRQSVKLGCVEEAVWRNGFITTEQLLDLAPMSGYGDYLRQATMTDKIGEDL